MSAGLIVDNFAGGGGASLGIELALGRSPDIAVDHDAEAVAMHARNHPATRHFCGDVWDVDPRAVCGDRAVALAWFSPDCKHHSKAKGGKPVDKGIRGLAWVVVKWARAVRPRVIMLENVEEFADWGPLTADNMPDRTRLGLTFRRWVGQLRAAGYVVEWRELHACDYGAPTTRKRLFVVARCDGLPIVWPAPTHGPGRSRPWRTAAECIDWSLPCPSIFERARPLADKTLRRIARGIGKFIIEAATPFIVPAGDRAGLRAPTLIQTGYGERPGQEPRTLDLHASLDTVVAGGAKHALVTAFLANHFGGHGSPGSSLARPIDTITARDHHALATASARGDHRAEVHPFLTKFCGTSISEDVQLPPLAVTGGGIKHGLVTVEGVEFDIADIGMRMLSPRELARAQGFPDSYVVDVGPDGARLTQTAQIRMIGNSVAPPVAAALVRANIASDLLKAGAA